MGKAKSNNDKILKYFRLLGGGRLRVTRVQGRDLLPLNPSECSDDVRHRSELSHYCDLCLSCLSLVYTRIHICKGL